MLSSITWQGRRLSIGAVSGLDVSAATILTGAGWGPVRCNVQAHRRVDMPWHSLTHPCCLVRQFFNKGSKP